jgi:hypothetical protein
VTAESTEISISSGTTERRPAIWPWLVMPLITLLLFYSLERLDREQSDGSYHSAGPQAADSATLPDSQ